MSVFTLEERLSWQLKMAYMKIDEEAKEDRIRDEWLEDKDVFADD